LLDPFRTIKREHLRYLRHSTNREVSRHFSVRSQSSQSFITTYLYYSSSSTTALSIDNVAAAVPGSTIDSESKVTTYYAYNLSLSESLARKGPGGLSQALLALIKLYRVALQGQYW